MQEEFDYYNDNEEEELEQEDDYSYEYEKPRSYMGSGVDPAFE